MENWNAEYVIIHMELELLENLRAESWHLGVSTMRVVPEAEKVAAQHIWNTDHSSFQSKGSYIPLLCVWVKVTRPKEKKPS